MRRRLLSAALPVAALLVLGPATSSALPLHPVSGSATFADTAGDGGIAPDVTGVTVSNDDQGLITFRITVANRTTLGPDDVIGVPIATDDPAVLKGRRGGDGATFVLGLEAKGAFLLAWNGVEMGDVNPQPGSVTGSFADGVATITVRQEDLAPGFPDMSVPAGLDFYVLGIAFSGNDVLAQDQAPDGTDLWKYRLSEPLRLIVTRFDPRATVKAGKTLTVLMGLAHGDTGKAVSSGKVTCSARIGGRMLKGTGHFSTVRLTIGGVRLQSPSAGCSWTIPSTAKGKTVQASIAVSESGMRVSRPFSTRVR